MTMSTKHPLVGTPYQGSIVKKVKQKQDVRPDGSIKESLEIFVKNGMSYSETRWLLPAEEEEVEPEKPKKRQFKSIAKKSVATDLLPSARPNSSVVSTEPWWSASIETDSDNESIRAENISPLSPPPSEIIEDEMQENRNRGLESNPLHDRDHASHQSRSSNQKISSEKFPLENTTPEIEHRLEIMREKNLETECYSENRQADIAVIEVPRQETEIKKGLEKEQNSSPCPKTSGIDVTILDKTTERVILKGKELPKEESDQMFSHSRESSHYATTIDSSVDLVRRDVSDDEDDVVLNVTEYRKDKGPLSSDDVSERKIEPNQADDHSEPYHDCCLSSNSSLSFGQKRSQAPFEESLSGIPERSAESLLDEIPGSSQLSTKMKIPSRPDEGNDIDSKKDKSETRKTDLKHDRLKGPQKKSLLFTKSGGGDIQKDSNPKTKVDTPQKKERGRKEGVMMKEEKGGVSRTVDVGTVNQVFPFEESLVSLNVDDVFDKPKNDDLCDSQSIHKKKRNKKKKKQQKEQDINNKTRKGNSSSNNASTSTEFDVSSTAQGDEYDQSYKVTNENHYQNQDEPSIPRNEKKKNKKKKPRKNLGTMPSALPVLEETFTSKTSKKKKKKKRQESSKQKFRNKRISVDPHPVFPERIKDRGNDHEIEMNASHVGKGETRKFANKLRPICSKPVIDESFSPPIFEKTMAEKNIIRKSFEENFAFSDLTDSQLEPILDAFEKIEFGKGETIAEQGKPDYFFYIIQDGKVRFSAEGERTSEGVAGDVFGELALIYSCDRVTTATAEDDHTSLLRLHQSNFMHIRRNEVAQSNETRATLLKNVALFNEMEESDLAQLSAAMAPHEFKADDNLSNIFQNSPFCLIQRGAVTSFADGSISGPGATFGESNIAAIGEVVPKIIALTDGIAYTIDKPTFNNIFGDMNRLIQKTRDISILHEIFLGEENSPSNSQVDDLARQISNKTFCQGEKIFESTNSVTPSIFIVRKGKVQMVKKNGTIRILTVGQYFGQDHFKLSLGCHGDCFESTQESISCVSQVEESVCGVLSLADYWAVMGRGLSCEGQCDGRKLIKLKNLRKHRVIGEGQFGIVWLVTDSVASDPEPYALKVQLVHDENRNARSKIMKEVSMMRALQQPFIVQLIQIFEEEDNISMLLSLAPGGELFDRIHYQLPGSNLWESGIGEEEGKFYCSVIADAVSFMHLRGYVYRDLKPENVLIGSDGYPLMTDFGFTKYLETDQKTFTMCGTPNYLPPEILRNEGHGNSADYWSFGVLLYEVVHGENPFWYEGLDQIDLFETICCEAYYPLPEGTYSSEFSDLIDKLLVKNPSKRLGAFREKDVLDHPWFSNIDIIALRTKRIEAPWKPGPIEFGNLAESQSEMDCL